MEKSKVFLSDPQVLFREGIHFILSGEDDCSRRPDIRRIGIGSIFHIH